MILEEEQSDIWQAEFYGVTVDVIRANKEPKVEEKKLRLVGMKDGKPVTRMMTDSEWKEFNRPKETNSNSKYDPDNRYNIAYGRHGSDFAKVVYGR